MVPMRLFSVAERCQHASSPLSLIRVEVRVLFLMPQFPADRAGYGRLASGRDCCRGPPLCFVTPRRSRAISSTGSATPLCDRLAMQAIASAGSRYYHARRRLMRRLRRRWSLPASACRWRCLVQNAVLSSVMWSKVAGLRRLQHGGVFLAACLAWRFWSRCFLHWRVGLSTRHGGFGAAMMRAARYHFWRVGRACPPARQRVAAAAAPQNA